MDRLLKWTPEDIKANVEGLKKDKDRGFTSEEDMGGFSDE